MSPQEVYFWNFGLSSANHLLLESKKTKVETRQSKFKCANATVGTQELM
jgi:hypothetical protein